LGDGQGGDRRKAEQPEGGAIPGGERLLEGLLSASPDSKPAESQKAEEEEQERGPDEDDGEEPVAGRELEVVEERRALVEDEGDEELARSGAERQGQREGPPRGHEEGPPPGEPLTKGSRAPCFQLHLGSRSGHRPLARYPRSVQEERQGKTHLHVQGLECGLDDADESTLRPTLDVLGMVAEVSQILAPGQVRELEPRLPGNREQSVGSGEGCESLEGRPGILQMLEHLAADHQIEAPPPGFEGLEGAHRELPLRAASLRPLDRLRGDVHSREADPRQVIEEVAGEVALPAPRVEDGRGPKRRDDLDDPPMEASDQLLEDRIAALVFLL